MNYEEIYHNEDYSKISKKAIQKYSKQLSPDELEQCRCIGIWKAVENYNNNKSKLSTFIYNNIVWECNRTIYNNKKAFLSQTSQYNMYYLPNTLFQELEMSLEPLEFKILSGKFIEKKSHKELSSELGLSVYRIRRTISELLERLKHILH